MHQKNKKCSSISKLDSASLDFRLHLLQTALLTSQPRTPGMRGERCTRYTPNAKCDVSDVATFTKQHRQQDMSNHRSWSHQRHVDRDLNSNKLRERLRQELWVSGRGFVHTDGRDLNRIFEQQPRISLAATKTRCVTSEEILLSQAWDSVTVIFWLWLKSSKSPDGETGTTGINLTQDTAYSKIHIIHQQTSLHSIVILLYQIIVRKLSRSSGWYSIGNWTALETEAL